jgi:hypothetical protein
MAWRFSKHETIIAMTNFTEWLILANLLKIKVTNFDIHKNKCWIRLD